MSLLIRQSLLFGLGILLISPLVHYILGGLHDFATWGALYTHYMIIAAFSSLLFFLVQKHLLKRRSSRSK